ncbi:MAG: class I SAM-dependent methyltransferase [Myxococcales bacterium]|nr:class I SAM-dependent methyltransferase [Myxococcales bacterium]
MPVDGQQQSSWDAPGVAEWLDGDWPSLPVAPALSALGDLVERHHAGGPILEVACGSGRTHEALHRRHSLRVFPYVGVDSSSTMLARARARYPSADFRAGDARFLVFEGWSFGSVLCTDLLQHVPEIETPIAEMLRVAIDHVFLMLWLSKSWAPPSSVEPRLVTVPEHGVRARFYEIPRTDEEVIEACERGGGRVLDLHVLEGERHDIGLFRVGVR